MIKPAIVRMVTVAACISAMVSCGRFQAIKFPTTSSSGSTRATPPAERARLVKTALRKRAQFDYRKSDVLSVERNVIRSGWRMVTEEITMMINDPLREIGKFEQRFLYYRYRDSGPRPTVLVFPLFGDDIWVDKLVAAHFWRKGFNSLIVISPEILGNHSRPVSGLNNVLARYTILSRMSIDMLESFPHTDTQRIYGYGMSMGGIRGAWVFGVDPRIRKLGIIGGGGNVAGMIAYTDYKTLADTRDARMIAENIPDQQSFEAALQKNLTSDPLDFACLRDPEDLVMVIPSNDRYLRNIYQEQLYDACSRPEEGRFPGVIRTPVGHMQTGSLFYIYVDRLAKFFNAPAGSPQAR